MDKIIAMYIALFSREDAGFTSSAVQWQATTSLYLELVLQFPADFKTYPPVFSRRWTDIGSFKGPIARIDIKQFMYLSDIAQKFGAFTDRMMDQ